MAIELRETKVSNAVSMILSLAREKKKDVLSDECEPVHLQISVKKIPKESKKIKLKLPHPIVKSDSDICLFVKDLDKTDRDTDPTIIYFESLLSKKGVTNVKEIIPIKSLKTDYKPNEARWNLSNAYDIYLADERIVTLLPRLLGKNFYGRKRAPTQINILAMDLKKEIERGMNVSQFSLSNTGAVSMAVVGHCGMSQEDITANVIAAVNEISETFPGSSDNIKQLSIKARSSTSIPLYLVQGGPQEVIIKTKRKRKLQPEIDELSTLNDGKVAVYPDGRVIVLKTGENLKNVETKMRRQNPAKSKTKSGRKSVGKSPKKGKKGTPQKTVKKIK